MDGNEIWIDTSVRLSKEHFDYLVQAANHMSDYARQHGLSVTVKPEDLISGIVRDAIDACLRGN